MEKSKTLRVEMKSKKRGQTKEAKHVEKESQPTKRSHLTAKGKKKDTGIVYVGHLPHGFYENELRQFFGQFGDILRVHVARSPRTLGSRGYGFVEFMHREVAAVAASAVNNYTMFGRRLVTDLLPPGVRQLEKDCKIVFGPNGERTTTWRLEREKQIAELNKIVSPQVLLKRRAEWLRRLRQKWRLLEKSSLIYTGLEDILPPSLLKVKEGSGRSLVRDGDADHDYEEMAEKKEDEEMNQLEVDEEKGKSSYRHPKQIKKNVTQHMLKSKNK